MIVGISPAKVGQHQTPPLHIKKPILPRLGFFIGGMQLERLNQYKIVAMNKFGFIHVSKQAFNILTCPADNLFCIYAGIVSQTARNFSSVGIEAGYDRSAIELPLYRLYANWQQTFSVA